MGTKYLVTGATGFVGASLARRLVEADESVHIIARPTSDFWRLADIRKKLTVHIGDMEDTSRVRTIIEDIKPDAVYHCVAYGAYHGQNDSVVLAKTLFLTLVNLVDALQKVGSCKSFINLSSSAEYGKVLEPMTEKTPLIPNTVYGAAKAGGTLLCQMLGMVENFPAISIRLFSPYGPQMETGPLVSAVISGCLKNADLNLTNGKESRDLVFIDDIVDCLVSIPSHKWEPGEILNVGSGRQYNVRQIVEKVMAKISTTSQPKWGSHPEREFDTHFWVSDCTKAMDILGWEAKTDIDTGLEKTISWFRSQI